MRIEFLPEAEQDIDRLYDFLASKDLLAAQKAMLAIDDAIDLLADQPRIGSRVLTNDEFRQLPIRFGKYGYVLQYRIQEDVLIVVRIWAGREQRTT